MKIPRAAVVVSLALVVGGCSEDEPTPSTLPPAPTASASAPAHALQVPNAAQAPDAAGASAFARFYLETVNKAFAAADSSTVRILSSPECVTCNRLVEAIERPATDGETIEGGDYVVAGVASTLDTPASAMALVDYGVSAVQVKDAQGLVIRERPASPPAPASMMLSRHEGAGWIVTAFTNVDP